jgi:glycosyltransferase involved in cell wall biosynthesis
MKLLQIIPSMEPRVGGPCQAVRNFSPRIMEQGNTVEVLCLDDPQSNYLAHETIPIHALGKGRGPWCYHPALRHWLETNLSRFDAVFLHGLWQYPGYALAKAAQGASMPHYFVFPHGMLDSWFQRARSRRLKAIRNWFYWKFIEQSVVSGAEAILFTCEEEMRISRETFRPYRPKREIDVGFGIGDPPPYHERMRSAFTQKCPGVADRNYFLFLGRIDPKKGVDLLIRGYAMSYTGKLPCCLVIAGPGLESSFGRQMQKLASKTCPPNSVFWPGMLTGDAKWGALYNAEAFALISHQENFGIAVVESLACETPVLISNKINIWREIKNGEAGIIGDDTPDGARGLLDLWQNISQADKLSMRKAAKNCYRKHYNIESASRNLLAAVNNLADTNFRNGAVATASQY